MTACLSYHPHKAKLNIQKEENQQKAKFNHVLQGIVMTADYGVTRRALMRTAKRVVRSQDGDERFAKPTPPRGGPLTCRCGCSYPVV